MNEGREGEEGGSDEGGRGGREGVMKEGEEGGREGVMEGEGGRRKCIYVRTYVCGEKLKHTYFTDCTVQ